MKCRKYRAWTGILITLILALANTSAQSEEHFEEVATSFTDTIVPEKEVPGVSIALAGGGWRALAMATGVFKAMKQQNVVESFDVIASNSGGSWFNAQYAYSKKFHDAVNNPDLTAGEVTYDYLNFRNTIGSSTRTILMNGWQQFVGLMMDSYDRDTSSKEMTPNHRQDDSSSELLFVTALPGKAHVHDLVQETSTSTTQLLDNGKPSKRVRVTYTVPPKGSANGAAWWLPTGKSFSDFEVASSQRLKVELHPNVGHVTSASSAFLRTMAGDMDKQIAGAKLQAEKTTQDTCSSKVNPFISDSFVKLAVDECVHAARGMCEWSNMCIWTRNRKGKGLPDLNDAAPCTWTRSKSSRGCGNELGQYRFVDGRYVDGLGLASLIAQRQAVVGAKAKIKVISVDNTDPKLFMTPKGSKTQSKFKKFDDKQECNILGGTKLWVASEFTSTSNGKLKYRKVSTSTGASKCWGTKAGTAVELLLISPNTPELLFGVKRTKTNFYGIGVSDPDQTSQETSDEDANNLKDFADRAYNGIMDPEFAKILKDFVGKL